MQALIHMLQTINFSAAVPVDDYLALIWAINAVIALGKEFCDSDCRQLSHCINEKSKEYFLRLHNESYLVLRQMVENEPWKNIPVKLGEMGGIIGIIKKNVAYNSDCAWGVRGMLGITLGYSFTSDNSSVGPMRRHSIATPTVGTTASFDFSQGSASPLSPGNGHSYTYTPGSANSNSSVTKNGHHRRILELFGTHGNLLHFMTDSGGYEFQCVILILY
jgi:hypothetical protein